MSVQVEEFIVGVNKYVPPEVVNVALDVQDQLQSGQQFVEITCESIAVLLGYGAHLVVKR